MSRSIYELFENREVGKVIESIILLLSTLFCNGVSCYIGYQLLGSFTFCSKLWNWVILISGALFLAFGWYFLFNMTAYSQISLLSLWIFPFVISKNNRKVAFVVYPFIYFASSMLSSIGTFIAMVIGHSNFDEVISNFWQMLFVLLFQLIIMFVFFIVKKLIARDAYIILTVRQIVIFYTVIFCSVALLSIIVALEGIVSNELGMNMLLVFASIACASLLFLAVYQAYLNTNQKLLREKSQLQADFQKIQQMYYETILKQNEDIRKFKHDINGHLQTIRYLNMEENVQDLEEYLQKIEQQTSIDLQTRYTGNKMIDILLVDLCNQANLNGIEVHVDGYLPNQLAIEEFDLTTVCFNLFKNALEATSQVTEKDKRYIDIFIDYVDLSHLVLEVKNGISQKVVIEGNHVRTTKEDVRNHGIGLRNVISTVEKYDGYLNLDSTETEFIAKVFL